MRRRVLQYIGALALAACRPERFCGSCEREVVPDVDPAQLSACPNEIGTLRGTVWLEGGCCSEQGTRAARAQVLVAEDQDLPQVVHVADDFGVFELQAPEGPFTLWITGQSEDGRCNTKYTLQPTIVRCQTTLLQLILEQCQDPPF